MADSKKVVSNYIFSIMYNILVIVTPLITVPYVSRVLGAECLGQYSYTQSIVSIFLLFGTLGTQIFAQREVAYNQDSVEERSRVFWEMLIFRMVMIGIVFCVYVGMIVVFKQYTILFVIQIIDFCAAFLDITWFFQGMEEFKKTVLRNMAVKIVIVVLIFVLVKKTEDLPVYVLFHSIALLLGNLSLYCYLPKYIITIPFRLLHPFGKFKKVLELFIPQIAVQIYATLDKTMLGVLCGEQDVGQVGYYEQAQKIIRMLLALIVALGTVMLPRMANAFSKKETNVIRANLNGSFKFIFCLGCPLMVGISAISMKLVPWFYGTGYEAIVGILIVTSPIIIISGINNLMGMQFLLPTQRQKEYSIAVTIASITNVLLNLILIPEYKAIGAVISSVLAEGIAVFIEIIYVRDYLELKKIVMAALKYFLFAMCMGVGIWLVGKGMAATALTTILQIVTGLLIYGILLIISKDEYISIVMRKFISIKLNNKNH